MNNKEKVYISGKMTGLDPEVWKANFKEAEIQLKELGFEPINPAELVPTEEGWSWKDYLAADIRLLFDCDGIYMLNSWGDSAGAQLERAVAKEMDLWFLYQPLNK